MSNSYTDIFTNQLILPSPNSYLALLGISSNVQLVWSNDFGTSADVVSNIIRVSTTGTGISLIMPDATHVSVGTGFSINNIGSHTISLLANDGVTVIDDDIASGDFISYYLYDNTTPPASNGLWQRILATGTSAVSSVGLSTSGTNGNLTVSGSPVTSSGTIALGVANDFSTSTGLTSFGTNTGIAVRTAANIWALRALASGNSNITISNPSGVASNPTVTLASTLTGLTSIAVGNAIIAANGSGGGSTDPTITPTGGDTNIVLAADPGGGVLIGPYPSTPITTAFYGPSASLAFLVGGANVGYTSFSVSQSATTLVNQHVLPTTTPTAGQVLSVSSISGVVSQLAWETAPTISGASTLDALPYFSNTGGQLSSSSILVASGSQLSGVTSLAIGNLTITSNTLTSSSGNIIVSGGGISINGGQALSLQDVAGSKTTNIEQINGASNNVVWQLPTSLPSATNKLTVSSVTGTNPAVIVLEWA